MRQGEAARPNQPLTVYSRTKTTRFFRSAGILTTGRTWDTLTIKGTMIKQQAQIRGQHHLRLCRTLPALACSGLSAVAANDTQSRASGPRKQPTRASRDYGSATSASSSMFPPLSTPNMRLLQEISHPPMPNKVESGCKHHFGPSGCPHTHPIHVPISHFSSWLGGR